MDPTITKIEAIPFRSGLGSGQEDMRYFATKPGRSNVLVVIHATDGLLGMGESVTAPYFSGETAEGAVALIEHIIAPSLVGLGATELNESCMRLHRGAVGNSGARKAVDVALHDLAARARGISVAELLGGALRDRFLSVMPLHGMDIDGDRESVAEATRGGIRAFKIKVGKDAVDDDIRRVREIRASEQGAMLVVDANQGWRAPQAHRFMEGTRDASLELLEQPLHASDIPGMSRLVAVANGGPAIAADEGVRTAEDALLHVRSQAADVIVLKLIKSAGFTGALRLAAVASAARMGILIGGVTGETGISTAASLQLAAVLEEPAIGLALPSHYVATTDITDVPCQPSDGDYRLPSGPGLGLVADLDVVEAIRLRA